MLATSLFRFKRGDHICVFYQDETALLEVLVPYLAEGLRGNERCFCVQKNSTARRIKVALQSLGFEVEDALARSALEIHTDNEVYFSDGRFDPSGIVKLLETSIAESVAKGFSGIRMAGELGFAAAGKCECNQLIEYENLVEAAFPGKPVIGICQYRIRDFSPETLDLVLQAHRRALNETMIRSNHSSLTIRGERHSLDIVADRLDPRSQFYYVAQEHGKNDIMGWGVEHTFDEAVREGETLLQSLEGL